MERERVKYGTKTVFGIHCVKYFCPLLYSEILNSPIKKPLEDLVTK